MLRAAREQQGMTLDTLASMIKVIPAKLEALEAGRIDALPDATFARALAQAVCRALKVDPAPVLAVMPGNRLSRLERVDEGLNTPFREHSGRLLDDHDWTPWQRPVPWLAGLLLVAAAGFALMPGRGPLLDGAADTAAQPASAAAAIASQPASAVPAADPLASAVESVAAASATPALAAAPAVAADAPDTLVVRALQSTWVQVVDGKGQTLASRVIPQGDTARFNGPLPLKLRIGNVVGVAVEFRGKAVDLAASNRNNTASLTLP